MWFRRTRARRDPAASGGAAAHKRPPKFGPRAVEALEGRALMSMGGHGMSMGGHGMSMGDHRPHLPQTSTFFEQTNLVSDLPGLAKITDPDLVNPWGLAHSPTSPWWINDNGQGVSTLYNGNTGAKQGLTVTIPPPTGSMPPSAPTGMVFNNTSDFLVNGKPATFIFDTEDGTVSAWNNPNPPGSPPPTNATLVVDNSASKAVYKGLAMGSVTAKDGTTHNYIYATDFHNGRVDVFDASFQPHTFFAGQFTDHHIPHSFAPFGIANINGFLFVTYAKQDAAKHDDVAGLGRGFVDEFDPSGHLIQRVATRGTLNSPWGLAIAPSTFGDFAGDLLVGNFGDGHINAFQMIPSKTSSPSPSHRMDSDGFQFVGQLSDSNGNPITIQGLWGLAFGNGGAAGPKDTLFFTAGIPGPNGNVEDHGLFGTLTASM